MKACLWYRRWAASVSRASVICLSHDRSVVSVVRAAAARRGRTWGIIIRLEDTSEPRLIGKKHRRGVRSLQSSKKPTYWRARRSYRGGRERGERADRACAARHLAPSRAAVRARLGPCNTLSRSPPLHGKVLDRSHESAAYLTSTQLRFSQRGYGQPSDSCNTRLTRACAFARTRGDHTDEAVDARSSVCSGLRCRRTRSRARARGQSSCRGSYERPSFNRFSYYTRPSRVLRQRRDEKFWERNCFMFDLSIASQRTNGRVGMRHFGAEWKALKCNDEDRRLPEIYFIFSFFLDWD